MAQTLASVEIVQKTGISAAYLDQVLAAKGTRAKLNVPLNVNRARPKKQQNKRRHIAAQELSGSKPSNCVVR